MVSFKLLDAVHIKLCYIDIKRPKDDKIRDMISWKFNIIIRMNDMKLLEERIRKDGILKEGNVLKVDNFLNFLFCINMHLSSFLIRTTIIISSTST